MVVTIEQIRDDGLTLEEPVSAELIDQALAHEGKDTGFRAAGATSLRATFHKISGGVLLQGQFAAEILAPCHRCLVDTRVKMPVSFMLNLIPKDLADRGDSAEGDDDEA